jgi:hypothetical protein
MNLIFPILIALLNAQLGTSSAERSETSVDLKEAHVSGIQPVKLINARFGW